jgi:hypothetical protein
MARRGPGAVGNGSIVAYGARSPVWRLSAKHAQTQLFLRFGKEEGRHPEKIRMPPFVYRASHKPYAACSSRILQSRQ